MGLTREEMKVAQVRRVPYGLETELIYTLRNTLKVVDECYDEFENSRSCNGCKHSPRKGENYSDICSECSRWYGDRYEKETK